MARESARIGNFSDFKIRFTRLSRRIEATDGCYDNNRDTGCASRVSKAMGVLSPGVFILVLHKCALGALGQVRLPAISCVEQSAESLHKEHTHSVLPRRGTTLFSLLFTINIYIYSIRVLLLPRSRPRCYRISKISSIRITNAMGEWLYKQRFFHCCSPVVWLSLRTRNGSDYTKAIA